MEDAKLVEMYRNMLKIRCFEQKVVEVFAAGKIPGFVHTYIGEEAVAVGVCSVLRTDDFVTSTHRGHGHCIAKGAEMKYMMAELFGRRTGYCKGRGGSMHIFDFDLGILGANGIIGAGIAIATGAGLSIKLRGTDQVVVSFFGDGGSNQGSFHESINMASLWKLPVIYVCENNQWAVSTPASASVSVQDIAIRSVSYGIPGEVVDGNDVIAVYEKACEAVEKARKGLGPTLLEFKTYRHRVHVEGYIEDRPEAERKHWMAKDPIPRLKRIILDRKILTEDEVEKMEVEIRGEADEAVAFAERSPWPTPNEALQDVYA